MTYGPEFCSYWLASELFAIAYLITSIGLGIILVLKTTRNTRLLFRVQLISLVVSIAAVIVLAVTERRFRQRPAPRSSPSTANIIFLTHYGRSARRDSLNSTEEESSGPNDSDAIRDVRRIRINLVRSTLRTMPRGER